MKRENIALVARARHDAVARLEVGRRYLAGTDGFPRHEQLALEYLAHPSLQPAADTARIICEHLDLDRIVAMGHESTLRRAADGGFAAAQFKLGAWMALVGPDAGTALQWIRLAARQGHFLAQRVERAIAATAPAEPEQPLLRALRQVWPGRLEPLALIAADHAARRRDLPRLLACIQVALADQGAAGLPAARCLKAAVELAIDDACALQGMSAKQIETCLEVLVADGDCDAAYWLGCAYCGIDVPPIASTQLVGAANMRKGVALLMRAADAGNAQSWMHLYRALGNHRCSVANPQLAQYFVEKAALAGIPEAQRRLGALQLRASVALQGSETALQWLHAAAVAGDVPAQRLLRTLVLPLEGNDDEADAAIALLRTADP
ncbi:MAG: hypothetical protein WAQ05_26745, partial [Rubrivivax sp.]